MKSVRIPSLILLTTALLHPACQTSRPDLPSATAPKDTCDDPDANLWCHFRDRPAALTSFIKLSPPEEPGRPLQITGTLYQADGRTPAVGVVLYAWHTDDKGLYTKTGVLKRHGHLHGWCRTDSTGLYIIQTIRPARYPSRTMPAHIHAAVLEPGKMPYYINDFVFADDSLVTPQYISGLKEPGGTGVLTLDDGGGVLIGERDIILSHK